MNPFIVAEETSMWLRLIAASIDATSDFRTRARAHALK
jgi:hypothetical protein